MPRYFTCPVGALLVGDVWMQAGDEVVITEEPELFMDGARQMVRIHGRIAKGWGRGPKIRTRAWPDTQTVEIRRGG
jgi:hypothetical protein